MKLSIFTIFFVCMIFLGLGMGLAYAQENSLENNVLEGYRLGVDDELRLSVYGEDSISGIYRVSSVGTLAIPLIGQVPVQNLTLSEAEKLISGKLQDGFFVDPSVVLEVSKYRPFYVMGEVKEPGKYDYVSDMNVLKAVVLAGGFTYRADQKTVRVFRHNVGLTSQIKENYQELPVHARVIPGDIILVKETFF